MSDLDILREMLRDEALAPIQESLYGKQSLFLREAGGKHAYEIQLHDIPEDIIAFKADKFPPPNKVFKGNNGECKRADFIVVADTPKGNWVIYIEMKGGKSSSENEIVQQLKGAECLLAYCRAIGKTFWSQAEFLNASYKQRFVSIKNIRMNKRPTRTPKSSVHDKPQNMLKLSSPKRNTLQFNQIING